MPVSLIGRRSQSGEAAFHLAEKVIRFAEKLLINAGQISVDCNVVFGKCIQQRNRFAGRCSGERTIGIISEYIELFFLQRKKPIVILQQNKPFVTQFGRERVGRGPCNIDLGTARRILCTFSDPPEHLGAGPAEKDQAGDQQESNNRISDSAPPMNAPLKSAEPFFLCFAFCTVRTAERGLVFFFALLPLPAERFGLCRV